MIKKYKTLPDTDDNQWILEQDENYYKKVNDFFKMIEKLSGFKVKRGIQKIKKPYESLKK